jgi:hypothetical protein
VVTKAVRFSKDEEEKINLFLNENKFFDFSTLARIAIIQFIENPKLEIKPIKNIKNEITHNETRQ